MLLLLFQRHYVHNKLISDGQTAWQSRMTEPYFFFNIRKKSRLRSADENIWSSGLKLAASLIYYIEMGIMKFWWGDFWEAITFRIEKTRG